MAISLTISFEGTIALVTDCVLSVVHAYNGNTDWVTSAALELCNLLLKIANNAIDLLNHRFGENLYLGTYFNGGNFPSGYLIARINNRLLIWYNFPECAIASTRPYSLPFILGVYYPVFRFDMTLELRRAIQCNKIFVEMHGNKVAKARIPVKVSLSVEQVLILS
jgi:hypothetical protein